MLCISVTWSRLHWLALRMAVLMIWMDPFMDVNLLKRIGEPHHMISTLGSECITYHSSDEFLLNPKGMGEFDWN